MKRRIVSIAFLLCISMCFTVSAEIKFSDANDVPWEGAKSYISQVADMGLMVGQKNSDGTSVFRAKDKVTFFETAQLAYNILKEADIAVPSSDVTDDWTPVMEEYNVAKWAYEAVAYCLDNKIVLSDELENFLNNNNTAANATRQDVAVIFGRAISMIYPTNENAEIEFKDSDDIAEYAVEYIELLADKKILLGDNNSNFNPRNYINRAEMAVIVTKTYDLLKNDANTVNGTINNILSNKIVLNSNSGDMPIYNFAPDINITLNGSSATYKDIMNIVENGVTVNVKLEINSSKLVENLYAEGELGKIEGTLEDITDESFVIKVNGGQEEYYKWAKDCKFYFEDDKKSISEIEEIFKDYDDILVNADVDSRKRLSYVELFVRSDGGTVEGAIKNVTKEKVVFYNDDNSKSSYTLAENVYVVSDNDKSTISGLIRLIDDENIGLSGKATLNRKKEVTKLEVIISDNLSGIVDSFDDYYITIITDAGTKKKYAIDDENVKIKFGADDEETFEDFEKVCVEGETEVKLTLNRDEMVSKIVVYTDFDEYDVLRGEIKNAEKDKFKIKSNTVYYSNSSDIKINSEKAKADELYERLQNGEKIKADVYVVDKNAITINANVIEAEGRITKIENGVITIQGKNSSSDYKVISEDEGELIIRIDNSEKEYTFKEFYEQYFVKENDYNVVVEFNDEFLIDRIYADTL